MYKICLVNDGFDLGGVQRVTTELANALNKNDNEVTVLDFSGKNYYYYKLASSIKKPNAIRKRTINRKIITKFKNYKYKITGDPIKASLIFKDQYKDLLKYLKVNNFDFIIVCQGNLTAAIPLIKKASPFSKIVAWQHNNYDVYMNKYYSNIIDDYCMGLEKADLVVCLTNEDVSEFARHNSNTISIYNPLTLTEPKVSNLNNKNIIFVGRLEIQQKGLDYLLEISKHLNPEWKIIIAGDGSDRKKFERLIKNNNLIEKIKLLGALSSEELADLYATGSIFISTSRWEGFGLVITEAMASGLPIVSFNNSGPKEITGEGRYGILIDKYDCNEFINAVNNLINNKSERVNLHTLSLERSKDFSISSIERIWIKELNKLKAKEYRLINNNE
ncbi:glycosyltransferase [Terribacillus aidingensis]|uniref:glycosyltransferase n=1 Tax=Terribacillus aidingensis TaxID=586416 RepID=UPI00344F7A6F